jgi:prepilin-type processing-associated H-X9-DG protein
MVAVAVIAVLIVLLVPAVQKVRASAARLQCSNHLKQIGLALHNYHNDYKTFPTANGNPDNSVGWMVAILPYLEQGTLYHDTNIDQLVAQAIPLYTCPAEPRLNSGDIANAEGFAMTSYVGVSGYDSQTTTTCKRGIMSFANPPVKIAQITDGTSNTLLVTERPWSIDYYWGWWYEFSVSDNIWGSQNLITGAFWGYSHPDGSSCGAGPFLFGAGPNNVNDGCSYYYWWSPHDGGGANMLFADGSVRWVSYSASTVTLALSTYAGNETDLSDY